MDTIILSALLLASLVMVFIQYRKIGKLKKSSAISDSTKNPNRRGVLREKWNYITRIGTPQERKSTYDVIIEIEELERLSAGLSRIKILKISGGANDMHRSDIKSQTQEIIETKDIIFTDEIEITDTPFPV